MTSIAALGLALLCATLMGLAVQRGSTCMVAAVDEVFFAHRATKLAALLEAGLWVCVGLLVARHLGYLTELPGGYAVSGWTILGAALLGLGAAVNKACAFGTLARLGSGQWAYLVTPLGFFAGGLSAETVFNAPPPAASSAPALLSLLPNWMLGLLLCMALGRMLHIVVRRRLALSEAWSPHVATLIIGVNFAALLLLAGAWTYTDVLIELSRGMTENLAVKSALSGALVLGVLLGGRTTGQLKPAPITPQQLARCAAGGLLMGWGGVLTPGGNDGLVLLGMPALWLYAWVSFAVMALVIASVLSLERLRSAALE